MSSPKELLAICTIQELGSDELWLSIPTADPKKSLYFSDLLTEEEQAFAAGLADATSGIDTADGNQKDRWYQYGELQDLDFCFEAVAIPVTRFSDGTHPVWYASNSQDGSIAEVTYHCRRQAALELKMTKDETVLRFERAFCKARARFQAYDLRGVAHKEPDLLENGPPYPYCNALGSLARQKAKGLLSRSRRLMDAEIWAVFERESILESRVKAFWNVEVNKDGTTRVCGNPIEYEGGWYYEVD